MIQITILHIFVSFINIYTLLYTERETESEQAGMPGHKGMK